MEQQSLPTAAVLTYPVDQQNIGTEYTPTYTWDKVATVTWYRLYVSGPSGMVLDQWYSASDICGVDNKCKVMSPALGGGAHVWYVQTYNPSGYGPWSNNAHATNFNTAALTAPIGATLTSPTGTTTNHAPTYTWNKVGAATWYRLYVSGPSGVVKDQWYQASSVCNATTCSTPGPTLENGSHIWWIQTYNAAGYGPWMSATFTVTP
jgi:hypothetical protein